MRCNIDSPFYSINIYVPFGSSLFTDFKWDGVKTCVFWPGALDLQGKGQINFLGQNLSGSIPWPAVKLIGELLLTKRQSSTEMTQYMGGQNFFQSDLVKTLTHFACSGINFVSLINLCSCKNMKFRHRFSQLSYQSFIFLLEKFLFGQNWRFNIGESHPRLLVVFNFY